MAIVVVLVLAVVPSERTLARSPAPILVELFTSEGCSSCPPADTLFERLIDAAPSSLQQIVGLGEHVDYWDHQGWRDRFSSSDLTERQRRYSLRLNIDSIYTPQMVVDGRFQFVGSDARAARQAIERARSMPHADVSIAVEPLSANRIAVTVAVMALPAVSRGDRADVVLAITEEGLRSNVRAGENHGRTLAHAAVVRRLNTIGEVKGDNALARSEVGLDAEWQRDNVRVVAFVQERSSRHVIGAAVASLQSARR
jgi:hypothetical protein